MRHVRELTFVVLSLYTVMQWEWRSKVRMCKLFVCETRLVKYDVSCVCCLKWSVAACVWERQRVQCDISANCFHVTDVLFCEQVIRREREEGEEKRAREGRQRRGRKRRDGERSERRSKEPFEQELWEWVCVCVINDRRGDLKLWVGLHHSPSLGASYAWVNWCDMYSYVGSLETGYTWSTKLLKFHLHTHIT